MPQGYAAVFIDGGYLDYVLREQFGGARIDYAAFVRAMVGQYEVLRAYYYHCLPYQESPPTQEQRERIAGAQRFFDRLRRLNRFEVREGKLACRGRDAQGHLILEQKRVDIKLGVDLVLLAAKQRIQKAVLFTGDSDFLPAIAVAKNEGVIIHLWHGTGTNAPHRDLWDVADDRTEITEPLIQSILRP